jgi:hypothetical protein
MSFGRIVYLRAYVADPAKRSAGFGLSMLPNLALQIGGLIGAIRKPLIVSDRRRSGA